MTYTVALLVPAAASADLIYTARTGTPSGTATLTYNSSQGRTSLAYTGLVDPGPSDTGQKLVAIEGCSPLDGGKFVSDAPQFEITLVNFTSDLGGPPQILGTFGSDGGGLRANDQTERMANPDSTASVTLPSFEFMHDAHDYWPMCLENESTHQRIDVTSNIPKSATPKGFSVCAIDDPQNLYIHSGTFRVGTWINPPNTPVAGLAVRGPKSIGGASRCRVANESVELATGWLNPFPNPGFGEAHGLVAPGERTFAYSKVPPVGQRYTPQIASERCKTSRRTWGSSPGVQQISTCSFRVGSQTIETTFHQFE